MKKKLLSFAMFCMMATLAFAEGIVDGQVIKLYDGKAPGTENWKHKERLISKDPTNPIYVNVSEPTITAYVPENPNGTAILVCPGGGFCILSYETEGELVARELNKRGITAFVLRYRLNPLLDEKGGELPDDFVLIKMLGEWNVAKEKAAQRLRLDDKDKVTVSKWCSEIPTQKYAFADADRAMAIIHKNATAWGLNPKNIGMVGFSAGAITTMHQTLLPSSIETAPAFSGVIYGGWTSDFKVPATACPLFIGSPVNDIFTVDESMHIYKAWRDAKVPTEYHSYWTAQHGFGAVPTEKSVSGWIEAMIRFMKDINFVK